MVLVQKEIKKVYLGGVQVRPSIPATAISLDKSSISLTSVGQTEQLTATLTPADSTSKITWSSSNTSIATVSNSGLVTCVTPGSCTITATTDNGLSASCSVKVPRLCFTANSAGSTITWQRTGSPTSVNLEKSTDGINWSGLYVNSAVTLSNIGDKLYVRNTSTTDTGFSTSTSNYHILKITGNVSGSGNIMYLLNKNGTNTLSNYCFFGLFSSGGGLFYAQELELPATTLTQYCYGNMFASCNNMRTGPKLPATTLARYCYYQMFYGCYALTTLPKLPASTLPDYCYYYMFGNANSTLGIYQQYSASHPNLFKVPYSTTGTAGTGSLDYMFYNVGGDRSTPIINTRYYTSATVV